MFAKVQDAVKAVGVQVRAKYDQLVAAVKDLKVKALVKYDQLVAAAKAKLAKFVK